MPVRVTRKLVGRDGRGGYVADFVYGLVAKNRYRIFGKLDACMIPPPEVRARFLA